MGPFKAYLASSVRGGSTCGEKIRQNHYGTNKKWKTKDTLTWRWTPAKKKTTEVKYIKGKRTYKSKLSCTKLNTNSKIS